MKIKILLLSFLSLFLICSFGSFAQSNYKEGYIVKLNGDTLKGFINYRDWDKSPKSFWFKDELEGAKKQFFPRHLKSFIVSDQLYISSIVPIIRSNKKKQLINRAEITSSSKVEIDTVFLEVLCIGKANLFYYSELNNQEHYLIETDSIFDELIYSGSYQNINGSIRKVAEFKEQLNMYLKDCEEIKNKIEKANFTAKGLIDIVDSYNSCASESSLYVRKVAKTKFQFYVLGGFSTTKVSFGGTSYLQDQLKTINFGRSYNPDLALAVNIVLPRNNNRISFYNEVLYSSDNFNSDYKNMDNMVANYKIESSYITLAHLLRYTFSGDKFRPFINAGISNGITLKNRNSSFIKEINGVLQPKNESPIFSGFKNYELSYLLGLGLSHKRFSMEVRYELSNGSVTHDYGYLTSKANRFHLLIGFQFYKN